MLNRWKIKWKDMWSYLTVTCESILFCPALSRRQDSWRIDTRRTKNRLLSFSFPGSYFPRLARRTDPENKVRYGYADEERQPFAVWKLQRRIFVLMTETLCSRVLHRAETNSLFVLLRKLTYSRTPPYGHLNVTDSSLGSTETRTHIISTYIIRTPKVLPLFDSSYLAWQKDFTKFKMNLILSETNFSNTFVTYWSLICTYSIVRIYVLLLVFSPQCCKENFNYTVGEKNAFFGKPSLSDWKFYIAIHFVQSEILRQLRTLWRQHDRAVA